MRKFVALDTQGLEDAYADEGMDAQPIVEVKESDKRIDISYRFPGFFRNDQEHEVRGQRRSFEGLEMAGVGNIAAGGKAELPSFGRYVQIPFACDFKVNVTTPGKPVHLEGVTVAPAQEKLNDGVGKQDFEYDDAFYASEALYPEELVSVTGPFALDGYQALLVHVHPIQYNPKRQLLIAHPRIEVSIELAPRAGATPATDGDESQEAFGNLFLNPRRDVGARVNVPLVPVQRLLVGPELLIVHATKYTASARELATWKNRRGLISELLEFSDDISTPVKAEAAYWKLRDEIRRRRSVLGARLRYVLLFGDVGDIPTLESALGNTTDYYYSTPVDYSAAAASSAREYLPKPWLSVGRIPARDVTEALSVVRQITGYERTPPADPAYYTRFVCAAHFQTSQGRDQRDYVFTMERVRALLTSLRHDAERVYTCDTPTRPLIYKNGAPVPNEVAAAIMTAGDATQRIIDATREGHLIIAHRDHGNVDGWSMPSFKLGDLDRASGPVPSLFFSLNCLTGAFDVGRAECFAEKNLRVPGTAPTLIASTELSSTLGNNALMLGLFDALYGGLIPTFPGTTVSYPIRFNRFGDILNYARSYLPVAFDPAANRRLILGSWEMYHVLGDPSLEVWAAEPRALRVSARRLGRTLQVDLSTAAPNCVVTVWLGDRLLKRLTPSGTHVVIPLPLAIRPPPLPPFQFLSVCCWAPGFRFAEARVPLRQLPAHTEVVTSGS